MLVSVCFFCCTNVSVPVCASLCLRMLHASPPPPHFLSHVPQSTVQDLIDSFKCGNTTTYVEVCACPVDYTGANCTSARAFTCQLAVTTPGYSDCVSRKTPQSGSTYDYSMIGVRVCACVCCVCMCVCASSTTKPPVFAELCGFD
jgi:hypothetical protein